MFIFKGVGEADECFYHSIVVDEVKDCIIDSAEKLYVNCKYVESNGRRVSWILRGIVEFWRVGF